VANCTFRSNAATDGGGMLNFYGTPTVHNCTFEENSASDGGGMYNRALSMISDCRFRNNSGGGMYNYGPGGPVVSDSVFEDNDGSGMLNYWYASATVSACRFERNSGSGIRSDSYSSPRVVSCVFVENEGGGMYNGSNCSPLTNCLFSGNTSVDNGGGMYNANDSGPTLINCTFSANSSTDMYGHGGGICNNGADPILRNCILWGNDAYVGRQIAIESSTAMTISFANLEGGIAAIYSSGGSTISSGGGLLDNLPLFVDVDGADGILGTSDDDLRLSEGSPCIDAADNVVVPFDSLDLDGDGDVLELVPFDIAKRPRFTDDSSTPDSGNAGGTGLPVVDMGAHEYAMPCDMDGDGDVGLSDYAAFAECLDGSLDCDAQQANLADPDDSGTVDLRDFAALQRAYTSE